MYGAMAYFIITYHFQAKQRSSEESLEMYPEAWHAIACLQTSSASIEGKLPSASGFASARMHPFAYQHVSTNCWRSKTQVPVGLSIRLAGAELTASKRSVHGDHAPIRLLNAEVGLSRSQPWRTRPAGQRRSGGLAILEVTARKPPKGPPGSHSAPLDPRGGPLVGGRLASNKTNPRLVSRVLQAECRDLSCASIEENITAKRVS